MKVGITARFQNSYFSGSVPQVALALSRSLTLAGHTVELLLQPGAQDWFVDLQDYTASVAKRTVWSGQPYDVVIEVCWSLKVEERLKQKTIYFSHYPPIFGDTETCVYQTAATPRDFKHLHAIWTYDFYSKQDVEYFELLSGVPVQLIPYVWDNKPLDIYVQREKLPSWQESAKKAESMVPADHPKSMSWCLRIFESNVSNSSHCVIPLNIVSEIRKSAEPVRFAAHNAETTVNNDFLKNNVLKNLILPDAPTNMIPRVRLPDTRKEKTLIVAHQRFRPMKSFLLDAIYLGIPMMHNNKILHTMGVAPYYYELNQIRDAVELYKKIQLDYVGNTGFFLPGYQKECNQRLCKRFSPETNAETLNAVLLQTPNLSRPLPSVQLVVPEQELRVAFADMWDSFVPSDNFFLYLLQWVGKLNSIRVVLDETNPNLVFWGPLSRGADARWPKAKKVFFTGENARPMFGNMTFLNLGFDYNTDVNYIRLPLWVLEINWWGADVSRMVNPLPVSIEEATTPIKERGKRKFCAFVASNPTNTTRNAIFEALNKWRPVDSGGRLLCNLPGGPIPGGLGGGGGELAKVAFYKNYDFCLTIENSSYPGYVTEKIFHAKVAGCVPIYWGNAEVDRDFDSSGFISITKAKTLEEALKRVQDVADKPEIIERMASIPAVTPYKRAWCEKTMTQVALKIFKEILGKDITVADADWTKASQFLQHTVPTLVRKPSGKRVFVMATNAKYAESAANALRSLKAVEPTLKTIVFIWPDVSQNFQSVLQKLGADDLRLFPVDTVRPWAEFWQPEHYAWKLWLLKIVLDEVEDGTSVLYCDSGMVFVSPLTRLWQQIETQGLLAIDDPSQTNARWCHPTFCSNLKVTQAELAANQIWAGCFGYRKGAFDAIANEALRIATSERESIVGNKWTSYTPTCLGHRHDQSILSILTQRARVPRLTLNDVYCDTSFRAAAQFGVPLYVHRGNFKTFKPLTEGIDEGYVINLKRRTDRLEKFKAAHTSIKDAVYVSAAVDGRALTLTPEVIHCFRNNDFKWKKAVMGCALSHLSLWEKLATDTVCSRYLIMEDDVQFQKSWLLQWLQMAPHMPQDADVVYLGGVLPPNKYALPHVTESVNQFFAKVAKNTLTSPQPRRYFHFCNYSYILTKTGAQKLVQLVKDNGIFTSGDHMIVNHGDELLNIYFTTPLLATCFQEDDPVYQKSEFNNFNRVDNFDSDLWNNTDCFSPEEVGQPQEKTSIQLWNAFMREVSSQKVHPETLLNIFALWDTMDDNTFYKNFAYFRIFEQFIVTQNVTLLQHKDLLLQECSKLQGSRVQVFKEILRILTGDKSNATPAIAMYTLPTQDTQIIYHLAEINPTALFEKEWLTYIFRKPLVWKPMTDTVDLSGAFILYQKIPDKMSLVNNSMQDWIQRLKTTKSEATLLHLSDEFSSDDISIYKDFTKVIRNYWRPNLPKNTIVIPLGYANGRSAYSYDTPPLFEARPTLWSFAGSLDRPGRAEALAVLKTTGRYVSKEKTRWESTSSGPDYIELLRTSQFVPCFGGSSALESYRLYEALEHGAIPFYVPSGTDTYKEMFGASPLLAFPSWEKAAQTLPLLAQKTEIMEKHRLACMSWWLGKKESIRKLQPAA